jgi:biopolymer transport protein ExbD
MMGRSTRRRRLIRSLSGGGSLKLTSMMDILTTLLLFLLKSFVAEGEALTPVAGVTLPESTSQNAPVAALTVAIVDDSILLGGEQVATVRSAVQADGLLIPALASRLTTTRDQVEELARLRGESEPFLGKVTIQGDRSIHFNVLQKVMFTCNQTGYDHIALAVLKSS